MRPHNVLHKRGTRAAERGRSVVLRVRHSHGNGHDGPADRLLSESEHICQEITRREARNFYWGFLALPRRQRIAIYALYSFSRQVDDEVDLNGSASDDGKSGLETGLEQCRHQRARIAACYRGEPSDPVMTVLSDVVREYKIPEEELEALVRGVEMDLGTSRYETWDDLQAYCRLVASAVGRMCTRIFGYTDPIALTMADDLGLAMQVTNILRDVREDSDLGRIYLPQEDLARFGVSAVGLASVEPGPGWPLLVEFERARAETLFESGLRIVDYVPRRAAVCILTMSGMYRSILAKIAEDPSLPLRQRTSLRKRTKLKVMLRSWLRAV